MLLDSKVFFIIRIINNGDVTLIVTPKGNFAFFFIGCYLFLCVQGPSTIVHI